MTRKKTADLSTRLERDMRMFFRNTNWAALWEEWYTSIRATGKYRYIRLTDFVGKHTKSLVQKKFMLWYLGPKTEDGESPYQWCKEGPQDWLERRKSGGWFTNTNMRVFGVEIRRRMTALEALREAGNGITLHSLVRAEQLAQELDRSFKGRMFLDTLTLSENIARAKEYISLHAAILEMKAKAQDLYAKSHGVNYEDMSGLTVLMQAAAINSTGSDQEGNKNRAALSAVVELALQKSQKYSLELPAGSVEVMTDAVDTVNRKKGLQ